MKKVTVAIINDNCSSFKPVNREIFINDLQMFGPGERIKVTLETYFRQRSLKQNGVLHWYCDELSQECSMEPEKFKELMKYKFLRRPVLNKMGEEIVDESTGEVEWYVPSTTELDTKEMAEFTENIRMWGLEFLNYELPLPDENYKINFLETNKQKLKQDGIKD